MLVQLHAGPGLPAADEGVHPAGGRVAVHTPFEPGQLAAGRFQLSRPLGAGGLAEVWGARDTATGAEVALKALHAHLCADPKLCERFRRELATTRRLDHPGIVRAFDLHEHEGRPFLTMELLRGRSLAERLREGALPRAEALGVAVAVLEALQAAHRAGVVHRDLTPANVFLCEDGAVKLLDFGLARVAGQARLTAQSTVLGTPGYLAPELLEGKGVDARADLYALGAVLFEMLAGQPAFPAADPLEVLRRKREPPPSARAASPAVSEADDALLRRLLEPDPERRLLEAGQALRALGGEAPPAPLPPPPALTAGQFDVDLQTTSMVMERGMHRELDHLGAPVRGTGWRRRLEVMGGAVLVSGASRASAEELAQHCHERGLACAVRPAKARSRVGEAVARRAGALAAAAGALGTAAAGTAYLEVWASVPTTEVLRTWGYALQMHGGAIAGLALLSGAFAALATWAFAGMGEAPPFRELPAGDRAVRRLMDGIARRVERIRAHASLAGPRRELVEELAATAERMRASAAALADGAAAVPDALSDDAAADTLPPGAFLERDAAVARLLEVAAALDEAWAQVELPSGDLSRQSQLLRRLEEETAFARRALPTLERARQARPVASGA